MKTNAFLIPAIIFLLTITGCDQDDQVPIQRGDITFSFKKSEHQTGGRTKGIAIPTFVRYTLKKLDGSTTDHKIELFEFNGDFVSLPQQLQIGHYTLEQFTVLDGDENMLYDAPVQSSELAELVQHPLPIAFEILSEEVKNLVPEVLILASHVAAFDVTTTIADNDPHPTIDYTLEIIAKDAPLGNVLWSTTIEMNAVDEIHIPSKYAHYTFRAIKQGYIDHVQHYLNADLSQFNHLYFEFLPENLNDFIVREIGPKAHPLLLYMTKSPCKLYARIDAPEGYQIPYIWADRSADYKGVELADYAYNECFSDEPGLPPTCNVRVNLYDNIPFAQAENYCDRVDLSILLGTTITMDEVSFITFIQGDYQYDGGGGNFLIFTHWQDGIYDGVPDPN
jgi:hypothetical protein